LLNGELINGPKGRIPLSEGQRGSFGVVVSRNQAIILMSKNANKGELSFFSLKRKLQEAGYQEGEMKIIRVMPEVLAALYENEEQRNKDDVSDTQIEQLFRAIIVRAHDLGASDVHIETRTNRAEILFRINGERHFMQDISIGQAKALAHMVYNTLADSASKEVTLDLDQVMETSIEYELPKNVFIQIRYESTPIYPTGNFQIVLRLLSMSVQGLRFDDLGYTAEQQNLFEVLTSGSSGMVLICGPTGSGKSTTLQAVLSRVREVRGETIKLVTVEDPVEYIIPGATQIPIVRRKRLQQDRTTGSVFTTFLRSTLRLDPDIVMIGEIRDAETADTAKDLILTGRKVFSTLHTYSAIGAFPRLLSLGVEREMLTMPGFISGIVYQRLLQDLCPMCSRPLSELSEDEISIIDPNLIYRIQQTTNLNQDFVKIRGPGCKYCKGEGIVGRVVVAEVIIPDRAFLKAIAENRLSDAEKHWKRVGAGYLGPETTSPTVLAQALRLLKEGRVDPREVEANIGLLTADMIGDADPSMIGSNSGMFVYRQDKSL